MMAAGEDGVPTEVDGYPVAVRERSAAVGTIHQRLARLAARTLDAPIAVISLGAGGRWSYGVDGFAVPPSLDGLLANLSRPDARLVVDDDPDLASAAASNGEPVVRAWAVVRMPTPDGPGGLIGVASPQPRSWSRHDREVLTEIAAVCASLAGSVDDSHELRRSRFLSAASGLLSSLPDVAGLPARLTRFCVPTVAAVAVMMQRYHGQVSTVGLAHRDPAYQARMEGALTREPITVVRGSGTARVLADAIPIKDRLDPGDPLAEGLVSDDGQGPWRIVVPILADGAVRGLLTWVADRGVVYSDDDVRLATEFAHRVALAWQWAEVFAERGRVTAALQQSLLPARMPEIPGLEIAARYVAADASVDVGGDFYDLFPVPDGRWLAVIGDVAGRGVEAAGVTGLARHTLRAIGPQLSPADSLHRLNRVLDDEPEPSRILTVAMARLNIGAGRMTVVRGGHCPPMLLRRDGAVESLLPRGQMIGAFPTVRIEEVEVDFAPGDTLVLYTDGVTEARRGDDMFGEDGLQHLLASVAGSSAEEVADRVLAAVAAFAGGNTDDDIALLVLRRPPVTVTIPRPRRAPTAAAALRTPGADRDIAVFSARAVSRLTGIPVTDLATWSDRYGLVVPGRTPAGTPLYSGRQLDVTRLLARYLGQHHDEVAAHAALADRLTRPGELPLDGQPTRPAAGPVLVVDRDTYLLSVIDRHLGAAAFEVITARTLAQARAAIADRPVGCVVVDFLLPGAGATDLCRDAVAAGIPVLTYSSLRAADQAFAADADAFLSKPLNAASLTSTVRDILTPAPATDPSLR